MAECVNCGTETQPGDLVTRVVDGHWKYFCSEKCHHEFVEPKAKTKTPPEAPTDETTAPPPAKVRRPRAKKASPKA